MVEQRVEWLVLLADSFLFNSEKQIFFRFCSSVSIFFIRVSLFYDIPCMYFSVGCIRLMFTATRSFQCLCCSTVITSLNTSLNFQICKRRFMTYIVPSCIATVVHYFLSPLLITHGFIALLLSNLLFMVGASYYHYLNFLGYDGKSHKFFL